MDFCTEFDTWLHRSCVQERLDDSGAEPDPELAIIAAELGMTPGSDNNDTGTSSSSPE